MDQNIKNRLVGVIVIFALAVIFLPMILDGAGVRKDNLDIVIPPPPLVAENAGFESRLIELQAKVDALPELDSRLIDENSPEKVDRSSKSEPEVSSVDKTPVAPEVSTAPKKVEPLVTAKSSESAVAKTGGDSWVLQVGSFQDRKKALVQRDKLRKSNIAAVFIEQFDVDSKASYRVRLGPFLNRDQTKVAQNKIKAKHNIDGIIMKYER